MEAAYSILQLVLARCNDPDAWHHVLTNTLPDLDHGRGLLDDLLELVHDVFVRVVDPRPRYDYASQLLFFFQWPTLLKPVVFAFIFSVEKKDLVFFCP